MTTKLERARRQLEKAQNASVRAMRNGDLAALDAAGDKAVKAFAVLARGPGRPPAAGTQRQERISATVPPEYSRWLKTHGGSSKIRELIEMAMKNEQ